MRLSSLHRVTIAVVVLLATATSPCVAAAAGQSEGQILRPQEESSQTILETDRVARLTISLPVSCTAAFDAWTDANLLVEWFSHWAEMTVDVGQGFQLGWEGYDGVWQGRYVEIDRPKRLAFTWLPPEEIFPSGAYETLVTLDFEPDDDACRLVLEHSGFRGGAEMDAQLQAWRGYLFSLRAFLLQPPGAR